MEITITVREFDVKQNQIIGLKIWSQTSPEEREAYEKLINSYGTKVLLKICGL